MDEDETIRRLLAQARHDEPLPPAVAERLDGVLADLVAERATAAAGPTSDPVAVEARDDRPAEVVDLSARRRRRLGTLVAAAAAVVVAGIGVGQLTAQAPPRATSEHSAADTAASGADSEELLDDGAAELHSGRTESHDESGNRNGARRDNPTDKDRWVEGSLTAGIPTLAADATDAQIRRALGTEVDASLDREQVEAQTQQALPNAAVACGARADAVRLLWAGEPAYARWLPVGEPDRIEISTCGGEVVRTVAVD
jgi:hypothetical protein